MEIFKTVSNTVDLQLESQPPGAEAKTSLGQSCRTPCTLTITAGPNGAQFTVEFTLDGYQPQTVSVEVNRRNARADPELVPNPAKALLEAIPPPEKPKPPPKRKPRVAKPAAAAPPNAGQASSAGFPPSSTSFPPPR
ncbi:MAG: hypothetical protein ACLPKB_29650 [Xanthobacteraceae bacterium]